MKLAGHATPRFGIILMLAFSFLAPPPALANNTAQPLPFSQDWTNVGLITANDDWSAVPGVIGYLGDDPAGTVTGVDPQTILVDNTTVDVIANQLNPNTLVNGGVAEFDGIANPAVALQGSGTADYPFITLHLDTTGQTNITVAYNLRDIDGSADNSIQQVALQFRVGAAGNFTNLPAGYVADATTGPSIATLVTPVSVVLPVAAENQPLVQVRIITTNAAGSDEWVGVDDITVGVGGGPTNPSGVGAANPSSVVPGGATLLTVTVTPGTLPPSTGLAVTGDLTLIGGAAIQMFFDDGSNGDATPADNIFSFQATVGVATPFGVKSLPITITDAQARTGSTTIALSVVPPPVLIHDIQGNGSASPLVGLLVSTGGIVTGIKSNGFFIQEPDASADADPNTSEGIFVFTSSAPPGTLAVGDDADVSGTVVEFIPSQDLQSPPVTEIGSPAIVELSAGNPLPTPFTITAADTSPTGSIEQLERLEGMRIFVASLTATSPTQGFLTESTATSTSNGTFYAVVTGVARPFREPGVEVPDALPPGSPCCVPRFDANPERLRLDTDGQIGASAIEVTTNTVLANVIGPLDYGFRTYTILPDPATPPTVIGCCMSAIPVPVPPADQFTVGSFNVQRLFDTVNDPGISDPVLTPLAYANRMNKLSLAIRNVMRTPDILGIEEAENLTTVQDLANKVNADAVAAGDPDPVYVAFLLEGNDIGGIDVGFLVKTARVSVVDVTQFGLAATYINPINGLPEILNDRPPLVLRATIPKPIGTAFPVTVIVNHLRSFSSIDDPVQGVRVRAKRAAQAEFLANLIQPRQATENIISVGDYNAFQFNDGYVDSIGCIKGTPAIFDEVVVANPDLVDPDLTDLVDSMPATAERYSYTFDGNAQVLDHIIISQNLLPLAVAQVYARNDADFSELNFRNDPTRPERISDHDMPVAYFSFPAPQFGQLEFSVTSSTVAESGGTATITVSRTGGSEGAVSVDYTTSQCGGANCATAGVDYTTSAGTLNWANGDATDQSFTVPIISDFSDEADETLDLVLSNPGGGATSGGPATLTIIDDDTAGITVAPTSGLVTTEAGGTAIFTIVLDSQPSADVTVGLSSSDTTEGTVPASVTLTVALWNNPVDVTVTGVDDVLNDGDVAYTVVTAAATSADGAYDGVDPADVGVTNIDDECSPDAVPPVVTPPAALSVPQSECVGNNEGASGATSAGIATFLAAGSATDSCDPAPVRLVPQVGGVDADNSTFFPLGATTVTFRFQDVSGNIGTADSTLTVTVFFGDLNQDSLVNAGDTVILSNFLVGNLTQGPAPFTAPLAAADPNQDTAVNAVDSVILANYLVGNIGCLPTP